MNDKAINSNNLFKMYTNLWREKIIRENEESNS